MESIASFLPGHASSPEFTVSGRLLRQLPGGFSGFAGCTNFNHSISFTELEILDPSSSHQRTKKLEAIFKASTTLNLSSSCCDETSQPAAIKKIDRSPSSYLAAAMLIYLCGETIAEYIFSQEGEVNLKRELGSSKVLVVSSKSRFINIKNYVRGHDVVVIVSIQILLMLLCQ